MPHSLPSLVISLDFELLWGVRDKLSATDYGKNILGGAAGHSGDAEDVS